MCSVAGADPGPDDVEKVESTAPMKRSARHSHTVPAYRSNLVIHLDSLVE